MLAQQIDDGWIWLTLLFLRSVFVVVVRAASSRGLVPRGGKSHEEALRVLLANKVACWVDRLLKLLKKIGHATKSHNSNVPVIIRIDPLGACIGPAVHHAGVRILSHN